MPKVKSNQAKEYKLVAVDSQPIDRVQIRRTEEAVTFIRNFYDSDISIYESSFMLLLNRGNYTIGWVKLSQGGITGTVMDEQLIAKIAIDSLAKGVIICHNHPSGNLKPSDGDISITNLVKNGLKLFGVRLLDHVILTETSYYSFYDEGII
jgi:DNA repair protein RadC